MMLSDANKAHFLSLKPEDISRTFMIETFAVKSSKVNGKMTVTPAKFKTTDTFYLTPDEYFVKQKTLTTLGRFIFNKFIVEKDFQKVLGYINEPINSGKYNSIEATLSEALLNDEITPEQFTNYLNKLQWITMEFNSVICASISEKSIIPIPKVINTRDKLMSDKAEAIANGDVVSAVKIEKDLLDIAKGELKNDPSMDLYNSGARGSFNNNYKAMYISKGPVYNPIEQKWDVIQNSYTEGLQKTDMQSYGNSLVTGQYSKSLGTPVAGYLFKRMNASFQAIVADDAGSDCGTKLTIKFKVTDANKNKLLDRYIVDKGKLVQLTNKNIGKYVGTEVNLRTTMYCKGANKCSKCLGERFYKLGIKNVGLTAARASTTILNLNMKKMHDSTAKLHEINIKDITL